MKIETAQNGWRPPPATVDGGRGAVVKVPIRRVGLSPLFYPPWDDQVSLT